MYIVRVKTFYVGVFATRAAANAYMEGINERWRGGRRGTPFPDTELIQLTPATANLLV